MSAKPPADNDEDSQIIYFPSLAERDKIKREQTKAEQKASAPAHQPFLNIGNIPPFAGLVAAAFILIHAGVMLLLNDGQILRLYYTLGFVPINYSGLGILHEQWGIAYLLSPFTYGFLHGSWMHLGFNIVMWLALGTFFEKQFGTKRAIRFFFLCALGGAAFHFVINPFSGVAVIGASASISGAFAVTLAMLYKRGMMGPRGRYGILPLLILWVTLMIVMGLAGGGMGENVAWIAHLGGFFTGLLYVTRKLEGHFKFWKL